MIKATHPMFDGANARGILPQGRRNPSIEIEQAAAGMMRRDRPFIAEIIGPPGAGKSTLTQALKQLDVRIAPDTRLRRLRNIPVLLQSAATISPIVLRYFSKGRQRHRLPFKSMLCLETWHRLFTGSRRFRGRLILLDQGPLYMLLMLRERQLGFDGSPVLEAWWNATLKRWMATLDLVIRLDTPNDILVSRIKQRATWHPIKDCPADQGHRMLTRHRSLYDDVITALTADAGMQVMTAHTSRGSIAQIAERVLLRIGAPGRSTHPARPRPRDRK